MDLSQCVEIINGLEYDEEHESHNRNFESIWYWEFEQSGDCLMIGEVNHKRYASLFGDERIYFKIAMKASLIEFIFFDCLDAFWSHSYIDYTRFNKNQIKLFDPNC